MLRRLRLAAALVVLAVLGGCDSSRSLISGNQRLYAYSWAEEAALGREYDPTLSAEYGLYDDPALTAYVARVGEAVLAESHVRRPDAPTEVRQTPFTFRVLDSPDVNAFALPGGYVYITRGLLAHLDSEAELAVVLGHEVAHVAARHTSQQTLDAYVAMAGIAGAGLLAELVVEDAGDYVLAAGFVGSGLLMMSHSRGHESESDRLGVEYAARVGYRAAEGAGAFATFRRLQAQAGSALPTFLSSHPDPGRREADVPQYAAEWAAQGLAQDRVGAAEYLAAVDGLVVGPDPRSGYVDRGRYVLPRAALRFAPPEGWAETLTPGRATFGAPDETALLWLAPRTERTAQAAVAAVAAELGATVEGHGAATADGRRAHVADAVAGTDADAVRARIWAVEWTSGVYAFVGAAGAGDYGRHRGAFDAAVRTLARASSAEVDVAPVRIRVAPAERSGSFRALVPDALPPGLTADDLAIMNGLDGPDEVVEAGRPLKLPVVSGSARRGRSGDAPEPIAVPEPIGVPEPIDEGTRKRRRQ